MLERRRRSAFTLGVEGNWSSIVLSAEHIWAFVSRHPTQTDAVYSNVCHGKSDARLIRLKPSVPLSLRLYSGLRTV